MKNVIKEDYHQLTYYTLLLLIGVSITGTLDQLPNFFNKWKSLLNQREQLTLYSSDITYLYSDLLTKPKHYYGEIRYRYK